MTIEAVLRHLGHDVRREVLPNGKLKFVTAASAPTQAGMALKPHRFHGGDLRPEDNLAWWNDDAALVGDRQAMATYFPDWVELDDADAPPAWEGVIDTGSGAFRVRVSYRRDRRLPRVQVVSGNIAKTHPRARRSTPHLYVNGDICVADFSDWHVGETNVADVVGWAAHWLACYVAWVASARWPTEGYDVAA